MPKIVKNFFINSDFRYSKKTNESPECFTSNYFELFYYYFPKKWIAEAVLDFKKSAIFN